jgi:hypothetical protein
MSVGLEIAKSTMLRFADQLLRELEAIQETERSAKMLPRTTLDHIGEGRRIRVRMVESDTQEALQRVHDDFAALVQKVMFHRMAVKLHYRNIIEQGDSPQRLKAVE